jgi:hypothetical protein
MYPILLNSYPFIMSMSIGVQNDIDDLDLNTIKELMDDTIDVDGLDFFDLRTKTTAYDIKKTTKEQYVK